MDHCLTVKIELIHKNLDDHITSCNEYLVFSVKGFICNIELPLLVSTELYIVCSN